MAGTLCRGSDLTAALGLGHLGHAGPDAARAAGDEDGLARFGLEDVEQAEVGRAPGHAQNAERRRRPAVALVFFFVTFLAFLAQAFAPVFFLVGGMILL